MEQKTHTETRRKCPKCKSRFGVFLQNNIYIGQSEIICFNGDCDFKMNIVDWNKRFTRSKMKDSGYKIKI